MKTISLLYLCLFFTFGTIQAQEADRNVALGGTFSFDYNPRIINEDFSLSLSPYLVFDAVENNQYGLSFNFSLQRFTSFYNVIEADSIVDRIVEKGTRQSYGIGYFYRKFISNNEKLNFFIQPQVGVNYTRSSTNKPNPISADIYHDLGIRLQAKPGLSYHFNKRLDFIATIGLLRYNIYTSKSSGVNRIGLDHDFRASLSLSSFNFGLEYRL